MTELTDRLRDPPSIAELHFGLHKPAMLVWHRTACDGADEIERLTAVKDAAEGYLADGEDARFLLVEALAAVDKPTHCTPPDPARCGYCEEEVLAAVDKTYTESDCIESNHFDKGDT
jgi:hypothetical protein